MCRPDFGRLPSVDRRFPGGVVRQCRYYLFDLNSLSKHWYIFTTNLDQLNS